METKFLLRKDKFDWLMHGGKPMLATFNFKAYIRIPGFKLHDKNIC